MEPIYTFFCPECGGGMSLSGLASNGDGDLYDEYMCDCCGYSEKHNTRWYDDEGNRFDDEVAYHTLGVFCDEEGGADDDAND